MRWWGWGTDAHAGVLPEAAQALLREELDLGGREEVPRRVSLDEVRLPEAAGGSRLAERLAEIVGAANVRADRLARVSHAAGKGYADLVRLRAGDASSAPDAVAFPGSAREVAGLIERCAADGVAVVPFGGGTSVVGGVEPLRGGFSTVISLDLARLTDVVATDRRSLFATLSPGLTGPAAERALGAQGLTLGHFPQSFEFATIGGFVATRSAGQASTGYGRIDELVRGVRCATPSGELVARPFPGTAAGPDLREAIVGSEGVLGAITEVTLDVRPAPRARRYEAWSYRGFEEGAEAFRAMEQEGVAPDVARLSDADETRLSMGLASAAAPASRRAAAARRAGRAYLRVRGHDLTSIAIVGWEGDGDEVRRRRSRGARLLRARGGVALGQSPGRTWARGRYAGPYLRDALLDRGVMAETLETATDWTNLLALYRAVDGALRSALAERGTPPIVMCHISHLYPSGASLYFTFLARQEPGSELEQWRAAKAAASEAIVATGGTITHHHAIGRDHAPWLRSEIGDLGVELLRAAKDRLDPRGIMNPGKLLPGPTETVGSGPGPGD
jgi:alkyldihydroxyacetonephosphate synthase